jgi:ribosomal protein S25
LFARRSRAMDEKRILQFLEEEDAVSETPISMANKLNVDITIARTVMDHLVEAGVLRRRDFGDIEPIYYRYPTLDERDRG